MGLATFFKTLMKAHDVAPPLESLRQTIREKTQAHDQALHGLRVHEGLLKLRERDRRLYLEACEDYPEGSIQLHLGRARVHEIEDAIDHERTMISRFESALLTIKTELSHLRLEEVQATMEQQAQQREKAINDQIQAVTLNLYESRIHRPEASSHQGL